jgi:CRISPR-associated protein Csb3
MNAAEPAIQIKVDRTNPGQFFACCGLLELADRLWPSAEGWFELRPFLIAASSGSLAELLKAVSTAMLIQVDPSDNFSSAIILGPPFHVTTVIRS